MNINNQYKSELGVRASKLAPLASKPNCVSSQTTVQSKAVPAVSYEGAPETQMARVANAIGKMPGAVIKQQNEHYLYAVFTSKLMRFKDDLEIFLDESTKQMHFRSASRVGYSDLGVNRKRYETFISYL